MDKDDDLWAQVERLEVERDELSKVCDAHIEKTNKLLKSEANLKAENAKLKAVATAAEIVIQSMYQTEWLPGGDDLEAALAALKT